jgi:hypothetical protein
MTTPLTNEEYDERKRFLEDLKTLSKTEHSKIFEILRTHKAEFSENSNGVFFDVTKLSKDLFTEIQSYMNYCRQVRIEQASRDEEERRAQDALLT